MAQNKMMICKTCGKELAATAKVCPACGAKNKKAIYKKWWFWAVVVLILVMAASGAGGTNSTASVEASQSDIPQSVAVKAEKFAIEGEVTEETNALSMYITGVVRNNSGKDCDYVQITYNLYDKDGNQIGTALDNINNFEKDSTWKFKALALAENGDIASYKLAEITGW